MSRKITQVAVASKSDASTFLAVAVAEDGTAWKIRLNIADGKISTPWVQIPPLPEEDHFEGAI